MPSPLWIVGAYLLGSVPTSLLVARAVGGVDLRGFGSGNLGATNLFRALGWKAAVPVALFDVAKGVLPVLLASTRAGGPEWWPLLVGLAAVIGHVFSPFVRFKGGKGVATAAGVFGALAPWSVLLALVVWLLVVRLTGYVSLGSMLASVAMVLSLPLLHAGAPGSTLAAAVAVLVFIVFTHRENIRRLIAGSEARFGRRTNGAASGAET
jgi:glycerol-3-phosphate acyltransferase PlsY